MWFPLSWWLMDDQLCDMCCIKPQFINCHNTKIACHRRTLSKMEWIYSWTKVTGQVGLEERLIIYTAGSGVPDCFYGFWGLDRYSRDSGSIFQLVRPDTWRAKRAAKFYHFNYIHDHDHDVISVVQLFNTCSARTCLAPAFDSALYCTQAPHMRKISNVATPLIFNCGWLYE